MARSPSSRHPDHPGRHDPADATLLLTVLTKVSGTRYHEPSARDAHRRIAAFFGRHLTA